MPTPRKTSPETLGAQKILLDFVSTHTMGAVLYTLCKYLCLNNPVETNLLFGHSIGNILNKSPNPKNLPETDVIKIFHKTWMEHAKEKIHLQANTSPFTLDWKTLDAKQAEWALFLLTPNERAIFLYRFLLNFPLGIISRILEQDTATLVNLFRSAVKKVNP